MDLDRRSELRCQPRQCDSRYRGWEATPDNPNHLWWTHRYATYSAAETLDIHLLPYNLIRETQGKPLPQIRRYRWSVATNLKLSGLTDRAFLKKLSVGGGLRWEDKAGIGYYGVQSLPAIITQLDPNRPIWDEPRFYLDLNCAYRTRLWSDKVTATFRLNVRNVQESGRLQGIGTNPDGHIHSYRIVDPRLFILSAAFEL